jgi:hypothetical protein
MFSLRRLGLTRELEHAETRAAWIAWARVVAVPFAFIEVAIESGNYPPGDEGLAWALASMFAAGALLLLRFRHARAVVQRWLGREERYGEARGANAGHVSSTARPW